MTRYYPFRPALEGMFLERFYRKAYFLCGKSLLPEEIERISREEFLWATQEEKINPRQRRIYRAVWLLLRDLLRARWNCRWEEGVLEIAPPSAFVGKFTQQETQEIKWHLRSVMSEARKQKLLESRDFILRMENPPSSGTASHSVKVLIADGESLEHDLRCLDKVDPREFEEKLRQTIQPYLQLVSEGERCEFTGHRLGDIWRYFRLMWSTPAENTPGRTLLYLVRDRARPFNPIIGIASLENSPLRIAARDQELGWTVESVLEEIEAGPEEGARSVFQRLYSQIEEAIGELKTSDLCSKAELKKPTRDLIDRLEGIAQRSQVERTQALRVWREREDRDDDALDSEELERSDLGNISLAAEEALFRRKRAEQLTRLLVAREAIASLIHSRDEDLSSRARQFIKSEKGWSAVWTALVAQKSRHVGTSILELNICGAIPPYNELLGGKLVALLILSPQVIKDYEERYGSRPSDIASRLKGKPVIRPARLVYIGTSSLYSVGSSQYNRLKLPTGLMHHASPEVRWQYLGETSGHGTWHISRLTLQCLEETAYGEDLDVNHVFGEGASPKLRILRKALLTVLDSGQGATEEFAKHAMPRLIYGTWLASNGRNYLQGDDEAPDYYFGSESPSAGSERIIEYWKMRWLAKRIGSEDVLTRIGETTSETLLVSRSLDIGSPLEFIPIRDESEELRMNDSSDPAGQTIDYLRDLYLGSSAYSDWADPVVLTKMHVPTKLDNAVYTALARGKSVVLTGNPGDGKTHLLRVLEPQIRSIRPTPYVVLDASTLTDADLYERWREVSSKRRPFCVAVNEAVLFSMADRYQSFVPLQEARRQTENGIVYNNSDDTEGDSVVVFDLSRRNVLSKDVVDAVIEKLSNMESVGLKCRICPSHGCDFTRNQKLIQNEIFRSRLQHILDLVSLRGYHATLRELTGFLSYTLLGSRLCDDLLKTSGEDSWSLPNLVYSGTGRLFDFIKTVFDPAQISHPIWDERLALGRGLEREAWVSDWCSDAGALDVTNLPRFITRKRAFYFFHREGSAIADIDSGYEREFKELLEISGTDAVRQLVRRINKFFGVRDESSDLLVWQSHRYDHSPRRILYSCSSVPRSQLQVSHPKLLPSMARGFDLVKDHLILHPRSVNLTARLRVDFSMFHLLCQADRGVPALTLDSNTSRRLWQFMEKLVAPLTDDQASDARITIFDPASSERVTVNVDAIAGKYHEIYS